MDLKSKWKCLHSYGMLRGLSYQDAEDFAQDASTSLHFGRKATTYQLLVDYIRRRGAMPEFVDLPEDIPEEIRAREEVKNPFEIGSQKWEVYDLYFNGDLSFGDIARKMGLHRTTVQKLIRSSIDIIRDNYEAGLL